MEILILSSPVLLSFLILLLPDRFRVNYTLALVILTGIITSIPAVRILAGYDPSYIYVLKTGWGNLNVTMDSLSAFFVLVVNVTLITGTWFARGYLYFYAGELRSGRLFLHLFSWTWLHFSMLAVLVLREGTAFLVAWELMGVSSFLLILFDAKDRKVLKTAVNYLVQMHIGFLLLLMGFLIVGNEGHGFGFDGLHDFFSTRPALPVSLLFFAGFAIKAGLIPFHTWLPEAHPAAPSHVSGVMSGVMIKMGFYGIFRVVLSLQGNQVQAGMILLLAGIASALYGIMQSIIQTDLKKALAWSTIENAGIIAVGIGLGTIGSGMGNHALTLLGYGGSLLHILNHSFFKSLLFYASGMVYQATHQRNMDRLGGLIHRMPATSALFLTGSLAICALPPFNGFISEMMIYYGMFAGLQSGSFYISLSMMFSIVAMAVTGGLAVFGFTRAFGITFLGTPRAGIEGYETAPVKKMVYPGILAVILMLLIGLAPAPFIHLITRLVSNLTGMKELAVTTPLIHAFNKISLAAMVLLILTGAILLLRRAMKVRARTSIQPTWGCGYTAPGPKQQYTAASYAANFNELANPLLRSRDEYDPVHPEELFPEKRPFGFHTKDVVTGFINQITGFAMTGLRNLAKLQTGYIQHYILYAFLFMLFVFALLLMNLI